MKELGSWIPQIFYDLIGRVAPGAFLLLLGSGLLAASPPENQMMSFAKGLTTTEAVSIGLVVSYMLGAILGGLAYLFLDKQLFTDVASITAEVPLTFNSSNMTDGQISFLYDALQFYNPAAGARLAKLRAEQHMCCVLFVGVVLLLVAYVFTAWHSIQWTVVVGLIATAIASRAFYLHLDVRARRLLVNYCQLLGELRLADAGPGGQPSNQDANQREQPAESESLQLQPGRRRLWLKRLRLLVWWGRRRD